MEFLILSFGFAFLFFFIKLAITHSTIKRIKTAKKCIIISTDSKKLLGNTIIRSAIGGSLLGPIGAFGGALTGKEENTTTFLVEYENGEKETFKVKNDSDEFDELCKKIDM